MIQIDEPKRGISIELTPLIDMVFLLLIFFLIATTFHQTEREMQIALPAAASAGLPSGAGASAGLASGAGASARLASGAFPLPLLRERPDRPLAGSAGRLNIRRSSSAARPVTDDMWLFTSTSHCSLARWTTSREGTPSSLASLWMRIDPSSRWAASLSSPAGAAAAAPAGGPATFSAGAAASAAAGLRRRRLDLPFLAGGAAADFLRNRPAAEQLPAGRPGREDRPGIGERPSAGDRQANRQDRMADRQGTREGRVGDRQDRRDSLANNRADRIDNRQEWQDNRQQRRDEVRQQFQDNHPRYDFWKDHPNWARWRWNRPYRWATWGALASWFPWGWSDPVYFSYGDNVYYEGDTVYYGDQPVATSAEYAEQALDIATTAPETVDENAEWMSLGVFAVTQDTESADADPTIYLQLVISKQGVIDGTVHNTTTDKTESIATANALYKFLDGITATPPRPTPHRRY